MYTSINDAVRALRRLPAGFAGPRSLLLRALAALWHRTAGQRIDLATGHAGWVEACALAMERAVAGSSPASKVLGAETLFWLLGGAEYVDGLLELVLDVRQTPDGVEVALIAAFDYEVGADGALFFEVVSCEPLASPGVEEETDFEDAFGALLEFSSDRALRPGLPAQDDIA